MYKNVVDLGETVRRSVRSVFPRAAYRLAHDLWTGWQGTRILGIGEYRRLLETKVQPDSDLALFQFPNLDHPFHVRPGSSDADPAIQTLVRGMYAQHLPPEPVRFIVDAGANIGDTTAWYLSRFPGAKVAAVEPDPSTFELLQHNCRPYGSRFIPFQAAIWPTDQELPFLSAADSSCSAVDRHSGQATHLVQGMSLRRIMEDCAEEFIDILKCDVEGAELPLFASKDSDLWLSRTRSIFIEIHGAEAERAVLQATRRHGFVVTTYRELHIFHRPLSQPK